MATKTAEQVKELLSKIRKGSTASFTVADFEAAFAALAGWQTRVEKEGRTVVAFHVTTPDGKVCTIRKEPRYKRIVFYAGVTFEGEGVHGLFDQMLLQQTSLLKDIEAVIGQVEKKVRAGREDARTCPVCFRNIKLDGNGKMVHHGYQRPGYGYIVGDCFAVGYEPWEVSPKGNIDYVAQVLKPTQNTFAERVNFLKSGKVESLTKNEPDYSAPLDPLTRRRPMKTITLTPADGYTFESLLENRTREAARNLKMVTEDIETREKQIAEWKAA